MVALGSVCVFRLAVELRPLTSVSMTAFFFYAVWAAGYITVYLIVSGSPRTVLQLQNALTGCR